MNEPLEKMKKDILINEAIIKKKIDELKIEIIQLEDCLKNKFGIDINEIRKNIKKN